MSSSFATMAVVIAVIAVVVLIAFIALWKGDKTRSDNVADDTERLDTDTSH